MLISVKFSNFRSYFYEQTLSLVAEKEQLLKENTFDVNPSLFSGKLLKTSMIAGTNASGKTNLFNVVKYIRFLVLSSSEVAREKRNVLKETNEIFALRKNTEEVPMSFEIEFLVDNEQYYLYKFRISLFS
jgi:AAA15 family ATPase/GTPase